MPVRQTEQKDADRHVLPAGRLSRMECEKAMTFIICPAPPPHSSSWFHRHPDSPHKTPQPAATSQGTESVHSNCYTNYVPSLCVFHISPSALLMMRRYTLHREYRVISVVVKKKCWSINLRCVYFLFIKNTLWIKDTESAVRMPQFKVGESKKGNVILLSGRCAFTDGGLCMTGLSHTSKRIFFVALRDTTTNHKAAIN